MEQSGPLLAELPTVAGRLPDEDIEFGLAGHLQVLRVPLKRLAGLLGEGSEQDDFGEPGGVSWSLVVVHRP